MRSRRSLATRSPPRHAPSVTPGCFAELAARSLRLPAPRDRWVSLAPLARPLLTAPPPQLTQNIAQAPTEPKFRKLKLTSAFARAFFLAAPPLLFPTAALRAADEKIAALVGVPGAMDTLLSLGWVRDADEVGDVLLLPPSVQLGMTNVRALDAAAERLADVLKARARCASLPPPPLSPSLLLPPSFLPD